MTRPSSPRVVDILADLAIQDAVDDYLQGADQVAAHQLWMRERMAGSERPDMRHNRLVAAAIEHGQRTAHGDHTAAEVK